jgi:uncharacterized membrane protein
MQTQTVDRRPMQFGGAQTLTTTLATVGVIAVGAAVLEAALIPGLAIGAVAVLAPRFLPKLRWNSPTPAKPGAQRRIAPAVPQHASSEAIATSAIPAGFSIGQALAKTVTFRVIVTTLDFTSNYLVIGELGTAAGLSAFALVVGPVFYFAHEAAWSYFGAAAERRGERWGTAIEVPLRFPIRRDANGRPLARQTLTINRALAKTITYRVIATTVEFTATYVVVGSLATAAGLSAFGFVLGPFVYFGHERAWEYFASPKLKALPAPTPSDLANVAQP